MKKNIAYYILPVIAALMTPGCAEKSPGPAKARNDILSGFSSSKLGENVFVFDPGMDMVMVQILLDTLFARQSGKESEFNSNRYALLFRPGTYRLDVRLDYYMQVLGLGLSPDEVIIDGALRSNTMHWGNVLTNFWRSAENLTVIPSRDTVMVWGVSQAAPLRRAHVKGDLNLFDKGYASGGFLANSLIDGIVSSGPQQQWFTRNTEWKSWEGGAWNMMFMGVPQSPEGDWPEKPYTKIGTTPVIREKPWLSEDRRGFRINVPPIKKESSGPDWLRGVATERIIRMKDIYVAKEGVDNSATINAALSKGKNILLTPGRYFLEESLKITGKRTVFMGIGLATLIPVNGNPVLEISDTDGVIVCGVTVDAGKTPSESLMVVGDPGSKISHSLDPVFLYDVFFRVGGPSEGSASSCLVINSNDVIIDHAWLWRADHGNGVGWDRNRCANGLIVNGDNVTIYGLFNEHFHEYQTLWNGNNGKVFFYQSEIPYDPPAAEAWKHGSTWGYASYKVADHVTSHEAWGIGIYNVFWDAPVIVDNAIETPEALESNIHHKVTFWLNGNEKSVVRSIINGKGGQVDVKNRKAVMK